MSFKNINLFFNTISNLFRVFLITESKSYIKKSKIFFKSQNSKKVHLYYRDSQVQKHGIRFYIIKKKKRIRFELTFYKKNRNSLNCTNSRSSNFPPNIHLFS